MNTIGHLTFSFTAKIPTGGGAVNIEYCKSAENKRCLLAYYRARKNKARRFKTLAKHKHIKEISQEYNSKIRANKILGGYYIY